MINKFKKIVIKIGSSILIDEKGKLLEEWRKVKVTGHALEVLETLKSLKL